MAVYQILNGKIEISNTSGDMGDDTNYHTGGNKCHPYNFFNYRCFDIIFAVWCSGTHFLLIPILKTKFQPYY